MTTMSQIYDVRLDVSGLEGADWDAWCEGESIEGVEFLGLQGHGLEGDCDLWRVTAANEAAARVLVEAHLVEGVTIQSVRPS